MSSKLTKEIQIKDKSATQSGVEAWLKGKEIDPSEVTDDLIEFFVDDYLNDHKSAITPTAKTQKGELAKSDLSSIKNESAISPLTVSDLPEISTLSRSEAVEILGAIEARIDSVPADEELLIMDYYSRLYDRIKQSNQRLQSLSEALTTANVAGKRQVLEDLASTSESMLSQHKAFLAELEVKTGDRFRQVESEYDRLLARISG